MKKTPGDIIILHKCTKNHDHILHCSWDTECDRCNYFHFGLFFILLAPPSPTLPNSPKSHNLRKMIKKPGYIIILHQCTKNHDHMLYCSWNMVHDRCNYFSFWAIFLPFYSPNSPKNLNVKKKKKTPGDTIISHMCTKNYDQMMYDSWDMVGNGQT